MLRKHRAMNKGWRKLKWKANAQIAHLVFADMQNANPKKPKELFFANARAENETERVILETELKDKNIYG